MNESRTFQWVFYIPDNLLFHQINISCDYGSCQISGVELSEIPMNFSHLKKCFSDNEGNSIYENLEFKGKFFILNDPALLASLNHHDSFSSENRMNQIETVLFGDSREGSLSTLSPVTPSKSNLFSQNSFSLEVSVEKPSLLVIPGGYSPNWMAKIDGNNSPVYCVDGISRGINIPAGKHLVTLSFRPKGFYLGLFISLLTLLIFFTLLCRVQYR
jgi:hypothetical protein